MNSNICFTFGVLERTNDQNKYQMKTIKISNDDSKMIEACLNLAMNHTKNWDDIDKIYLLLDKLKNQD